MKEITPNIKNVVYALKMCCGIIELQNDYIPPTAVFRSCENYGGIRILRGRRVPDTALVGKIIIDEGMILL